MKTSIALFSCLFIFMGFFSSGVAAARESQTVEIKVATGDNLYDICNIYLADFRDWPKVAEVNGLKDPGKLYPGQKLKIPTNLLQGTTSPGRVSFVAGEVMSLSRSLPRWLTVEVNHLVYPGDSIRTGKMSSAEIRLGNGHWILLRENTMLTLKTSRKLSTLQRVVEFFLTTGRAILKIRDLTGKGSRYEIQTPSAVAAARGTHFRTAVDVSENMRCEVLAGSAAVTALGEKVELHPLQGTLVARDHAPLPPVKLLTAPAVQFPEALYRSLPLKLHFNAIDQAVSYRVELAGQDDFRQLVFDRTVPVGTKLRISDLEDGTYYLRSRSIDKFGLQGPSSAPLRFALRANPQAPFLQLPKADERIHDNAVTFRWMNVYDAQSYHLQVAEDPDFRRLIADIENIGILTHRLDDLSPLTYFCRIRSIAADGYRGEWSSPLSFVLVSLPASPQGGEASVGKDSIEVKWRNIGPGFHYHIQIAEDEAFESVILDEKTPTPDFSFKKPETVGTYYIRISSIDPQGVEGKFSKPQSFEVKNPYAKWIPVVMVIILIAIGL